MLIFYNMKLHRQYRTLTLSVKSHHTVDQDQFSYSDHRAVFSWAPMKHVLPSKNAMSPWMREWSHSWKWPIRRQNGFWL